MKENYVKLINACLPDALIKALEEKTGLDRKNVEYVCLEVVARIFGDGNDLTKISILKRLKTVIEGEELKNILSRLETKYGITTTSSGAVLNQLLPLLFKRLSTLDDSYFEQEPAHEEVVQEEVKPVVEEKATVEDVYKNIEKKAEAQYATKPEVKEEKKHLFHKKEKVKKEEIEGAVDTKELSLVEKICIWSVVVALVALIATIAILFIKQSL